MSSVLSSIPENLDHQLQKVCLSCVLPGLNANLRLLETKSTGAARAQVIVSLVNVKGRQPQLTPPKDSDLLLRPTAMELNKSKMLRT